MSQTCHHYSNERRGHEFRKNGANTYAVWCAGCGTHFIETEDKVEYEWWLHATTSELWYAGV